ncbi:MAG: hypothetical protein HQ582_01145 [Planctomycetes bacterium]|nr:hypothetical protein [Planctomycetota bacterium]
MLRRLLSGFLSIVAFVVFSQAALADGERKPPRRTGPESFFMRLDANQDRQVTEDEIPDRAPEGLKAMLRRADKNNDKKITAEELAAAARQHRPGPPAAGERPSRRPSASAQRGRPHPPGPPFAGRPHGPAQYGMMGHGPMHGPMRGPMHGRMAGPGRGAPPHHGRIASSSRVPDPKAVFARLDRNKDQQLSLEEFSAGMMARVRMAMAHRGADPRRAAAAHPERRKPSQPKMSPEARKKATEARKKKAEAARAAAAKKRKAQPRKTPDPEARKKAAEARKKAGEARKKAAEAKKKEASPAEKPDSDQ